MPNQEIAKPTVTIADGVSIKGFDATTCAAYLSQRGLNESAITNTTINLLPPTRFRTQRESYLSGRVAVRIGSHTSERDANKRLYHGLEHRIDEENGRLRKWVGRVYRTLPVLLAGEVPVETVSFISIAERLHEVATISSEVGGALVVAANVAYGTYLLCREERSARRAAKNYSEPIILFNHEEKK